MRLLVACEGIGAPEIEVAAPVVEWNITGCIWAAQAPPPAPPVPDPPPRAAPPVAIVPPLPVPPTSWIGGPWHPALAAATNTNAGSARLPLMTTLLRRFQSYPVAARPRRDSIRGKIVTCGAPGSPWRCSPA